MTVAQHQTEVETAEQVGRFVECVYDPSDIVEVRFLPSGASDWFRAPALSDPANVERFQKANDGGQHVHVGLNPRRGHGGRSAADVTLARVLWADFDDTSLDAVQFRLSETALPAPTMMVHSGHGVHIYWRLEEPITDLGTWSQFQKDLAALLQSDPAVHDPPRLTRLPGFVNHKEPPAECTIIDADPERVYALCDLHDAIPSAVKPTTSPEVPPDGTRPQCDDLDAVAKAANYARKWEPVGEGERNTEATRHAACLTHDFALSDEQAFPILAAWNARNAPPLPDDELRKCLQNGRKHGKHPSGEKRNHKPVAVETPTADDFALDDPAEFAKAARLDVHHGPLTEQTLAERMVHRHGKDLRFCTTHGWLVWTGQRWRRDDLLEVERRVKETILSLGREAFDIGDDIRRKAVLDFARSSETNHRRNSVIALARSERGIPIRAEDLDGDPWLLNCENGTIDLRRGELRAHDRADLITKIAPVIHDPDAECPQWIKFLADIFAGDASMIAFVKRALGHALTGVVRDHILHILYGTGANGKTTLIECIIGLLGDYGMPAAPGLLLQKHNEQHPTERADLRGKRFVADEELGEGQRLNEQTVKRLTGGNTMKGRYMHKDFFDFPPTHKLFLATNHKPEVHGRDFGIWRRVHLWPFAVTIADADQDKQLPEKLRTEWPGILAWLVTGCLDWQRIGLAAPEAVVAATNTYREESDLLGHFIGDCCETGDGKDVGGGILYTAYRLWCQDNGHRAMSNPNFSKRLLERAGITRERTAHSKYLGLWLTYSMNQRVKRNDATNETQTTVEDDE